MQFELLEAGPSFGLIVKLTILYMTFGVIAMLWMLLSMRMEYRLLRRRLWSLIEPILVWIKKGVGEPSASSFADAKDSRLNVYAMALRQELSGQGPLAIIEALNRTFSLLDRRLELRIYYLRLLGWSICFVGVLGALSHALGAFRAAQYFKDVPLGAYAAVASEATEILLVALFLGLVSLAGSYFSESRLSHLSLELSDRIHKAAEERIAQDMKIGRV